MVCRKLSSAIVFFLITIIPFSIFSQQQKGYTIDGQIGGMGEGEKVSMWLSVGDGFNEDVVRDSSYVDKGIFHLSGIVPEGPRMYTLKFDKHPAKYCILVIDNNEQITITGSDIGKSPQQITNWLKVEGSPTNYAWNLFKNTWTIYLQSIGGINSELRRIRDSIGFLPFLIDGLMRSKRIINNGMLGLLLNTEEEWKPPFKNAIPWWLHEMEQVMPVHPSFLADVYNSLDEKAKNSFYGKILKEQVSLSVGQTFPEFNLPTVDGKLLALKSIIGKNKITVVQFWASNSYDVDKFQDELKMLHKKYRDKGLNIIGVCSDTSAKKWKIAMQDLPWHHVSDLKGKDGIVGRVYHEAGGKTPNTTNVLIDNKGKIVAWDVNGVELQWYLWRTFGE